MFPTPTATGVHRLRNTWSFSTFSAGRQLWRQPVKSSEIENETVNDVEAEAEAMEFENGERCFMPL